MLDLEEAFARLRALSPKRRNEAAQILTDFLEQEHEGSLLTDEQWAIVQATLANPGELIDHEEVEAEMRERYGL